MSRITDFHTSMFAKCHGRRQRPELVQHINKNDSAMCVPMNVYSIPIWHAKNNFATILDIDLS